MSDWVQNRIDQEIFVTQFFLSQETFTKTALFSKVTS